MAASPRALALFFLLPIACSSSPPPNNGGATDPPKNTEVVIKLACPPGTRVQGDSCVEDCPKDTTFEAGKGCVSTAPQKIAEAPPPEEPPPPPKVAASASNLAAGRDPRKLRKDTRSRSLVVTELQQLETMFAQMAKTAPDRPKLMKRLAEGYIELESVAEREKASSDPNIAAKGEKIRVASNAAAIKYLSQLKNEYPKWCDTSSGSNRCSDEVLYYLAYEYEISAQLDNARKAYLNLVQNYPQSDYVPYTYFAFGELFFVEAQGDPSKWMLAEQSYLETIKYSASPIVPDAFFKLGQVYENKGDRARAKAQYKKLLAAHPQSAAASQVPAWAR